MFPPTVVGKPYFFCTILVYSGDATITISSVAEDNLQASNAYSIIGLPIILQYCFGLSAPNLVPRPADIINTTFRIYSFFSIVLLSLPVIHSGFFIYNVLNNGFANSPIFHYSKFFTYQQSSTFQWINSSF